ncbi:MAG: hypothetical protein BMS9Abin17_0116 [Acidimicrobiia bacterium]|nr:MAG: hypothetical protein BMS9Abin17_0116 [Acidimicrobiia bacterium]
MSQPAAGSETNRGPCEAPSGVEGLGPARSASVDEAHEEGAGFDPHPAPLAEQRNGRLKDRKGRSGTGGRKARGNVENPKGASASLGFLAFM